MNLKKNVLQSKEIVRLKAVTNLELKILYKHYNCFTANTKTTK